MHHLELRIPPVVLWTGVLATIVLLTGAVPAVNAPFPGHRMLSVVLLVVGAFVVGAGVVEFRRARTTVNPLAPDASSSLVVSGIYRYTRNPMYLGMAVALAGAALWRASLPGLLLVPLFCAYISRFQIRPEERILTTRFGEDFTAYMARVRRWI